MLQGCHVSPTRKFHRYTAAGNCLVACNSPAGRLGLSTCYDVRFPGEQLLYECLPALLAVRSPAVLQPTHPLFAV